MDIQVNAIDCEAGRPELLYVPKEDVPLYWPQVLAVLREKPDSGALAIRSETELYCALIDNPWYGLWIGVDGGQIETVVIVTAVTTSKDFSIWLESGHSVNMRKYVHFIERIEKWAFDMGARAVKFNGPRGWMRVMARYGYEAKEMVFEKDVRRARSH